MMKSLDLLKNDINSKIRRHCEKGDTSFRSAYTVETKLGNKKLEDLCDYLIGKGYVVKLTHMTVNLRQLEISWNK